MKCLLASTVALSKNKKQATGSSMLKALHVHTDQKDAISFSLTCSKPHPVPCTARHLGPVTPVPVPYSGNCGSLGCHRALLKVRATNKIPEVVKVQLSEGHFLLLHTFLLKMYKIVFCNIQRILEKNGISFPLSSVL